MTITFIPHQAFKWRVQRNQRVSPLSYSHHPTTERAAKICHVSKLWNATAIKPGLSGSKPTFPDCSTLESGKTPPFGLKAITTDQSAIWLIRWSGALKEGFRSGTQKRFNKHLLSERGNTDFKVTPNIWWVSRTRGRRGKCQLAFDSH